MIGHRQPASSPFTADPETVSHRESSAPGPLTLTPTPRAPRPFPVKPVALSAHVSPRTSHFPVLDKSPLSGSGRGPPSCNTAIPRPGCRSLSPQGGRRGPLMVPQSPAKQQWPRAGGPCGDLEGSRLQAQLAAMAPVQRNDPLGSGPAEPSEEPRGVVGWGSPCMKRAAQACLGPVLEPLRPQEMPSYTVSRG